MAVNHISLPDVGAALAGLSALSTAAFGLLDATKVLWGGPSNLGILPIYRALTPFRPALANALGAKGWWPVIRANWIAGVPKAEQKAKAQAIIRLGLASADAAAIAAVTHVDAAALQAAVTKLETGATLTDADLNVLGRMNATIEVLMDAAFEKADQAYRNWCRVLAGLLCVGLALVVQANWPTGPQFGAPPTRLAALIVGLLAVPLAPLAKDLTSGLSAAMQALKSASKV
jgi:hypothetical protein